MCACVGWCVRLPEVLSPLVSHCLTTCVGFCVRLPKALSSLVSPCRPFSHCLPLSPIVAWLPVLVGVSKVLSPLVSPCLPLSPIVSSHVCLCWMVCPRPCLPCLPAFLPAYLPACLLPFFGRCVGLPGVLSSLAFHCLPHVCLFGWCVTVSAFLQGLVSQLVFLLVSLCYICAFVGLPEALSCLSPSLSPSLFSSLSPSLSPILSPSLSPSLSSSLCWKVCRPSRGLVALVALVFQLVSHLVPPACLPACFFLALCWMMCPPFRGLVSLDS